MKNIKQDFLKQALNELGRPITISKDPLLISVSYPEFVKRYDYTTHFCTRTHLLTGSLKPNFKITWVFINLSLIANLRNMRVIDSGLRRLNYGST